MLRGFAPWQANKNKMPEESRKIAAAYWTKCESYVSPDQKDVTRVKVEHINGKGRVSGWQSNASVEGMQTSSLPAPPTAAGGLSIMPKLSE